MFLETKRLILRNLKESDEKAYIEYHNSEFVLKFNCMQKETTQQFLAYCSKNRDNPRHIVIADKSSDAFIGMIFVQEDSLRYCANSLEMSYWLGEPYSGQGFMAEALEAAIQFYIEDAGKSSVTVRVFADNERSVKLMHKLHFQQEGHLHNAVLGYDGKLHDDLLFSRRRGA